MSVSEVCIQKDGLKKIPKHKSLNKGLGCQKKTTLLDDDENTREMDVAEKFGRLILIFHFIQMNKKKFLFNGIIIKEITLENPQEFLEQRQANINVSFTDEE